MKEVEKQPEDWIKPFATVITPPINVDKLLREKNIARYFLQMTIPESFDAYAIALHSFWINYNIAEPKLKTRRLLEDKKDNEDEFSKVTWKEFYSLKGLKFDLNKAISNTVTSLKKFDQLDNELYPGESLLDREHIKSLIKLVDRLYGDEGIEVFYCFLSTLNLEKDLMFEANISELDTLIEQPNLNFTPSLIYSKNKNWVVNSDYDLNFTTIGGSSDLIQNLINEHPDEIYQIKYR